jgi:hypothetical protein
MIAYRLDFLRVSRRWRSGSLQDSMAERQRGDAPAVSITTLRGNAVARRQSSRAT